MIGKRLVKYKCDPYVFSTSVYGIVGIIFEDGAYAFTNTAEAMDYFGALEDVAIFKMKNIPASSIRSKVRNLEMIDTPVGSVISNVLVVNERQMLFEKNELVYEVKLTRGVIFIFEDGHELSFEKNIWFSEDINVEKGYNLIERFTSTDEFVEGWSGDYHGECTREILSLK